MPLRVSRATLSRVDRLDGPIREAENRAAYVVAILGGTVCDGQRQNFTKAQRTVLGFPPIARDHGSWEAEAGAQQERIMAAGREDRGERLKPLEGLEDVSHRYKPVARWPG